MISIPVEHCLLLSAIMFSLGLLGVLVRRNIIFVLMSMEVMFNAVGLAFVSSGARWVQADGQVMFLLVLTLAAAEVAIGLALVLQLYQRYKTLDIETISKMKG